MINTITGDLLSAKGVILHGVNCQGVMGSGVALSIKNKWPIVYEEYMLFIKESGGGGDKLLGKVNAVLVQEGVHVINCFTQDRYGRDGKMYVDYSAMDRCMKTINVRLVSPIPINFPLIGCGLAGGHWPVVREIIDYRIPDTFTKNLYVLPE